MITSPEPDIYGQYARASLLADYVELIALQGQSVRRSIVADFLSDTDDTWDLGLIRPAESGTFDEESRGLGGQIDKAQEDASIVFRQIAERNYILADRYPFEISGDIVSLGSNVDRESNPYVAVLALTVAHAFKVASACRTRALFDLFERTVTSVLRARGLPTVGLAAVRRGVGSFEDALRAACECIGLKAAPDAAPTLAKAHDEGGDVLCHFGWEQDLRPGTWGFIGQVTVGKSDSWRAKIKEPSPATWARLTGTWVQPMPFLAVPHHVERPMMEKLTVDGGQAIVLDRLRLVRFKNRTSAEEQKVIQAVLQEDIEPLAG